MFGLDGQRDVIEDELLGCTGRGSSTGTMSIDHPHLAQLGRPTRGVRIALALALATAGCIGALGLSPPAGAVAASGGIPADPPGGAVPLAPSFNDGIVSTVRGAGSGTTLSAMQQLGDLYTGAGIYGCTLNTLDGQTLYNSSLTSTSSNEESYCQQGQNPPTADTADNWDRTEVSQGVDDVSSTAAQSQLCGTTPTPLPVDFVRSSAPVSRLLELRRGGHRLRKGQRPDRRLPTQPVDLRDRSGDKPLRGDQRRRCRPGDRRVAPR